MQNFDCLALNCPLMGPHLLEASAGTGKTFSIEHVYVRLILEGIEVGEILAVTFTKAATRELKARIRANLEKAEMYLKRGDSSWEYLKPHLGSNRALRLLSDALASFDRCQIFTIHGFCYRMLKESAFEADVSSLLDPERDGAVSQRLRYAVYDFLEHGIDENLLCKEQLALLFKEFDSIDEIAERLLHFDQVGVCDSFSELLAKCKAALHGWPGLEEQKLLEDFQKVAKNYKATLKGDFESQLKGLVDLQLFPLLLKEKGSVFNFLSAKNRKIKQQEVGPLNYPQFFEWAQREIAPLTQQKVFPILQMAWNKVAEKILAEEEIFDPDRILTQMKKALCGSAENFFLSHVRKKYKAAIIDEFQDTDPIQWEIFQKLFFVESMKALYLVGDPKQSIYRFRKADVYTYLEARDLLGERSVYQLNTNFRSSKSLIGALNALFERDWLSLPKVAKSLPYYPVNAGADIASDFHDGKGSLHFFLAEGEPNTLFDEVFLPFAIQEIERLKLKRPAILVKDRFQREKALAFLQKRNIAAVAKSHIPLGQTQAFKRIEELFQAVSFPHDRRAAQIVMAGPFATSDLSFSFCKAVLEKEGLVKFAQNLSLDADALQIFEHLFAWEKKEGFSFEGLRRCLQSLKKMKVDEGAGRRMEVDEEAVQVMTLHISKGLEFDVVFALGLVSRTPASEELKELEAEKKRQLYVAMTRAKKRLYVPFALSPKEPEPGTESPMELFARHFEGSFRENLMLLSKKEDLSFELLTPPITLEAARSPQKKMEIDAVITPRPFTSFFLSSFTTLAQPGPIESKKRGEQKEEVTLQTMPRGADTGIIIHSIFEDLFSSKEPQWRDPDAIDLIVENHFRCSSLLPWKKVVQEMVQQTVKLPLVVNDEVFRLTEVDEVQAEMEFLFSSSPNFVKGVIDLVFYRGKQVYFIDWKTNWLEDYNLLSLEKEMQAHDYGLQVALYREAIERHFKVPFGGAFYVFVRGGQYLLKGNHT